MALVGDTSLPPTSPTKMADHLVGVWLAGHLQFLVPFWSFPGFQNWAEDRCLIWSLIHFLGPMTGQHMVIKAQLLAPTKDKAEVSKLHMCALGAN
jgi:hypothetical protein